MEITLYNIREKIFSDSEAQKKLYYFKQIFDQWNISYSVGGMESRLKSMELELLNSLDNEHIEIIKEHFNVSEVTIRKISNNLSKNYKISKDSDNLPKEIIEYREFCVSITKDDIYLTLWR